MSKIYTSDDNYFNPLNDLFREAQMYMFDPNSTSKFRKITKDDLDSIRESILGNRKEKEQNLEESMNNNKVENSDTEKRKIKIKNTDNGSMYIVPVPGYELNTIHVSCNTKNNEKSICIDCEANDYFDACNYTFNIKKSLDINTAKFKYRNGVLYAEFKNIKVEDNSTKTFNIEEF